jgi:hypothetical protein
MCFFEDNHLDGWQYCDLCKYKLKDAIIEEKKYRINIGQIHGRKPLYINVKEKKADDVVINFNSNINPVFGLNLKCSDIAKKMGPNYGKLKFLVHNGGTLRMSQSLNVLIWIEHSTGIYSTFSQLIKENPSVFGNSFEDSIFEIDTQLYIDANVKFWLKELEKSYILSKE